MSNFDSICRQLKTMRDAGLQDSPTYERLADMAMKNAPSDVISHIMTLAVRENRLPPPMGVDQNGERLWKLEDVAAHFGLSPEETKRSLERFQLEHGDIPDNTPAHRIH